MADLKAGEKSREPANRLQAIDGGRWRLWRWVGLRSAGIPAHSVFDLAGAADAADRLLESEDRERRERQRILSSLGRAPDSAGDSSRASIRRAVKCLKKGVSLRTEEATAEVLGSLSAAADAEARLAADASEYRRAFAAAALEQSARVEAVARSETFREAVMWQNRQAVGGSIKALLNMPAAAGAKAAERRKREALVAKYLQRYAVKNDTIGRFGPVGWARLNEGGMPLDVRHGSRLLAERNVYLEVWCADALAAALSKDGTLRRWVAPQIASDVYLDGDTLYLPSRDPLQLPAKRASALRACDGRRSAREIALGLGGAGHGFDGEAEVYDVLRGLEEDELISWSLEVPIELHPERTLRRALERVDDVATRSSKLAQVSEVEGALERIGRAAGNADELDEALGHLDVTFSRITGLPPTRSPGATYAGRTLAYEDCRRDVEVEIGHAVVAELGPPLSLLLTSARWFTRQVSAMAREFLKELYQSLKAQRGARPLDFPTFWYSAEPLVFGDRPQPVQTLLPAFQRMWAELLALPAGVARVGYSCEGLRERVSKAFAARDAGRTSTVYHSPDVMIAASGRAAVERGDYQFVLGEMHAATNTLRNAVFIAQHPAPAELQLNYELDSARARAVPVISKMYWPSKTARLLPALTSPQDWRIEFAPEPAAGGRARVLPFGHFVVEECDGGLVLRTRDGRLTFDLLDAFTDTPLLSTHGFSLLPPQSHTPRVLFDRLVVARESWSLPAREMDFAFEKDGATRFLAARRWARSHAVPRFAFVKTAAEPKPFYLDFDSPLYVDIFAKAVRQAAKADGHSVAVTEMLPTHEGLWLSDAQGQLYTCELRLVAVDPPAEGRRAARDANGS